MNENPRPSFKARSALLCDAVSRVLKGERQMVIAYASWVTPDIRRDLRLAFGKRILVTDAGQKVVIAPAGGVEVKIEEKKT